LKRILFIIPYEKIYPPQNGGMQRCFHIMHQLSINYNLSVLTFQKEAEFYSGFKNFQELKNITFFFSKELISFKIHFIERIYKSICYRIIKRTFKGPADSNLLRYYPMLKHLISKNNYDFIILENISTLNAVSIIRKLDKNVKLIYDAHNFDTHLASIAYRKKEITYKEYQSIEKKESNLHKLVNMVWVCSKVDKEAFEKLNVNQLYIAVIPNGATFNKNYVKPKLQNNFNLLFCGSLNYGPNKDGLNWFIENCWKKIFNKYPNINLNVIGSGEVDEKLKTNLKEKGISFWGNVDEVESYYHSANASIVPLFEGSGTRLKVLESFSFKVPVISTTLGAEGINYTAGTNILLANDVDTFLIKIDQLMNPDFNRKAGTAGYKLGLEHYDWNSIGKTIALSLQSI
jgi:glycosyltransferase involved in cell wall biosynthesis